METTTTTTTTTIVLFSHHRIRHHPFMIELDAPLDPKKSRLQTQLTTSRSILGQTDTIRAKNIRQLWTNFIEAAKSFAPHPNPRDLGPVATICCLCRNWHEIFDIDRLNPHLRAILKPRGLRVRTDPGCKTHCFRGRESRSSRHAAKRPYSTRGEK